MASEPRRPDGQPDEPERKHPTDLDATFAGIVAGFDLPVDPTAAPWPAAENLTHQIPVSDPTGGRSDPPPAPGGSPPGPVDARHLTEPSLLDALDTFGVHLPDLPESHERFIPPPPPPLPRLSRQTVLGTLAVLVGMTLLLVPGLLPLGRGNGMLLGFAVILGGATALFLRLRPGTDPDDTTPDDGARV